MASTKAKATPGKARSVAKATPNAKKWATAFLMCPLGAPESEIRKRADELQKLVIEPALETFRLRVIRSDRDLEPGTITRQIMRNIWQARVVIADLTSWNPNVFFELGVAQAWHKPVVLLSDQPGNNPFDVQHERTIGLGFAGRPYAGEVERVRDELRDTLEIVLAKGYKPQSVVTDFATALTVAGMASKSPVASQIAGLSDGLSELASRISGLEYALRQNAATSFGSVLGARSYFPTSGVIGAASITSPIFTGGLGRFDPGPIGVSEFGLSGLTSFKVSGSGGLEVDDDSSKTK
jgi:hypothetical protein